ncbi:hypothetical protein [Leeuwenhoekiella marinoflava]|uniref:Uncharacterized protein n=2 Tax=Leeuwenhoekiella marinoflava TaxID=988 RepID=A0A4V1KSI0_9FLAO|nr:hypothetical protein [Leeuwenhoekiella marinoflava]RXG31808.1 hypothetical protein DSL99_1632 [Leeuwenhoekiella marinoflava]SHF04386.1 hypothetical protein SAMN02745246_01550 [Leeuwenhoekiella marinoflava DSM 3653]
MKNSEANIEIERGVDNALTSVTVFMPIWDKDNDDDETISIDIPLLGLKTIAKDVVDADAAIKEAIELFCLSSEKFGKGLENDLKVLGWSFGKKDGATTVMNFDTKNSVFNQIFSTGDQFAQKFDLAS